MVIGHANNIALVMLARHLEDTKHPEQAIVIIINMIPKVEGPRYIYKRPIARIMGPILVYVACGL